MKIRAGGNRKGRGFRTRAAAIVALTVCAMGSTLLLGGALAQPTSSTPIQPKQSSYTAPNTPVGGTSSFTVALVNLGSATGTVQNVKFTGPFALATNGCAGVSLAFMQSCTLKLNFAPSQAGPSTGTFNYTAVENGQTYPGSVPVSGTGVASTSSRCKCVHMHVFLDDFNLTRLARFTFKLHWKLDCTTGSGGCSAKIKIGNIGAGHLNVIVAGTARTADKGLLLRCKGPCENAAGSFSARWYLAKPKRQGNVSLPVALTCRKSKKMDTFILHFDPNGHLVKGASVLEANL